MTTDEIIEQAIQGHASAREAILWAIKQEREECIKIVTQGTGEAVQTRTLNILNKERMRIANAIRNKE